MFRNESTTHFVAHPLHKLAEIYHMNFERRKITLAVHMHIRQKKHTNPIFHTLLKQISLTFY